jgi:hypothetical protein
MVLLSTGYAPFAGRSIGNAYASFMMHELRYHIHHVGNILPYILCDTGYSLVGQSPSLAVSLPTRITSGDPRANKFGRSHKKGGPRAARTRSTSLSTTVSD